MSRVGALVTQSARDACERDHTTGEGGRCWHHPDEESWPPIHDRDAGDHALHPDAEAVRVLGPAYINAIASKLEHNTTRPAATSARNPSDTKSSLRMVHLPMAMLVRIY